MVTTEIICIPPSATLNNESRENKLTRRINTELLQLQRSSPTKEIISVMFLQTINEQSIYERAETLFIVWRNKQ